MPRHAFRFDSAIKDALKQHVVNTVNRLSRRRYEQEPAYSAALFGSLDGFFYGDDTGSIKITSTITTSLGRGSAESWSGADFSVVAEVSDGQVTIRKGILFQAKDGRVGDLDADERERLISQIEDMKHLTRSPKVIEYPRDNDHPMPEVISGRRLLENQSYRPMRLDSYFVARVLTTFDGDTRPDFVESVQESRLPGLR